MRRADSEAVFDGLEELLRSGELMQLMSDARSADKIVERAVSKMLAELVPGSQVISEESVSSHYSFRGSGWVLDPVDGSRNLLVGLPSFAVGLGLLEDWKCTAGAIVLPSLGCVLRSDHSPEKGYSKAGSSATQVVGTGFAEQPDQFDSQLAIVALLLKEGYAVRELGSALHSIGLVALGRLTGFVETGLAPWDIAPSVAILDSLGIPYRHSLDWQPGIRNSWIACGQSQFVELMVEAIRDD